MTNGRGWTIAFGFVAAIAVAASVTVMLLRTAPGESGDIPGRSNDEYVGHEADGTMGTAPRVMRIERFGVTGWRQATPLADADGEEIRATFRDRRAAREAKSLSGHRPELAYYAPSDPSDDDEGPSLVGPIDPWDGEAVRALIAMNELTASGHTSAPPRSQVDSIGRIISAMLPLLSVEGAVRVPSSDDEMVTPLEDALRAGGVRVPERFRIWRLLAMAEHSGHFGTSSSFDIKHDAEILELASALRRRSSLSIRPIDGGMLTGRVTMSYQTEDRTDRAIAFSFVYDRDTGSWILYEVVTAPSYADQRRYYDTENYDALFRETHTINLLVVLPDCVVVTGEGLHCERK